MLARLRIGHRPIGNELVVDAGRNLMAKLGVWSTIEVEGGAGCVFEPKDFR